MSQGVDFSSSASRAGAGGAAAESESTGSSWLGAEATTRQTESAVQEEATASMPRPPPPPPPAPPVPRDELQEEATREARSNGPDSLQAAELDALEALLGSAQDDDSYPPGLLDVVKEPAAAAPVERPPLRKHFDTYWTDEAVQAGLANRTLFKGLLRASNTKLNTAMVTVEEKKPGETDLLIRGKSFRNRANHMDIVVCQLVGQMHDDPVHEDPAVHEEDEVDDEHRRTCAVADEDSDDEEETVAFCQPAAKSGGAASGAAAPAAPKRAAPAQQHQGDARMRLARVVAIADPKGSNRIVVCTLHPNPPQKDKSNRQRQDQVVLETDTLLKAMPTDKRMPWMLIKINDVTKRALNIPGRLDKYQLWPVQMVVWSETSTLPLGRLKGECLGKAGDMEAEEKHALLENDLDCHDVDFKEEQLDEVDQLVTDAQRGFDDEVKGRLDLRHKRIFTIDPATARDLDDAIHVDYDEQKREVEIGVHIADVSHFVKANSLTDKEAQWRTTSVYLIGRVLPMLPYGLCNHLCSLNPNEPKLSFSVFYRLNLDTGDRISVTAKPWFKKTAMTSCCRLNYEEVQKVLDGENFEVPPCYGGHEWEDIKKDIFILYDVCGKVRRNRFEGGALSISKQKMIFHTRESEDRVPTGYHLESHSASHWIIEELMLLANRSVAEHLASSRLNCVSVLRRHEAPDPAKADKLAKMMQENLGLDWSGYSAGEIYRSCQAIYRKYGAMLGLCVEFLVMRSGMKQAEYFVCNNDQEEDHPHHFALDFSHYLHFTSPIRRYPDVMVHRVLQALLVDAGEDAEQTMFQQPDAANNQMTVCNEKKQASRKCQEQLDRAIFCIFLRKMKCWFYNVGTVMGFQKDKKTGASIVTVYCSQLGRESKIEIREGDAGPSSLAKLQLFSNGVDDQLLLPKESRQCSRGLTELVWLPPDGDQSRRKVQQLKMLSCVPIVIIPTDTVPIDYAMFFVSPFHPKAAKTMEGVPKEAEEGFEWSATDDFDDGVQVGYDAFAPGNRNDPDTGPIADALAAAAAALGITGGPAPAAAPPPGLEGSAPDAEGSAISGAFAASFAAAMRD